FFIARIHPLNRIFCLTFLNPFLLIHEDFFLGLPLRLFLFFTPHEFLRVFFSFLSLPSLLLGVNVRVSREALTPSSLLPTTNAEK
ncbi:hypothetical protein, partial [Escherichia coli]|uniref:hypothetical protein n=1 Tax=Escherichia coli TaxID=562 RepID=UPI003F9F564B